MMQDFWRYFILYIKGGIYANTYVKLLKPIEDWEYDPFNKYQVVLGTEWNKQDHWILVAVPGHPFFKYLIEYFFDYYVMFPEPLDPKIL